LLALLATFSRVGAYDTIEMVQTKVSGGEAEPVRSAELVRDGVEQPITCASKTSGPYAELNSAAQGLNGVESTTCYPNGKWFTVIFNPVVDACPPLQADGKTFTAYCVEQDGRRCRYDGESEDGTPDSSPPANPKCVATTTTTTTTTTTNAKQGLCAAWWALPECEAGPSPCNLGGGQGCYCGSTHCRPRTGSWIPGGCGYGWGNAVTGCCPVGFTSQGNGCCDADADSQPISCEKPPGI